MAWLSIQLSFLTSTFLLILPTLLHSKEINNEIVRLLNNNTDGFVLNKGNDRFYKLMYDAKNWTDAKAVCETHNGFLAVPRNEHEFKYLQDMAHRMSYSKVQGADSPRFIVYIGINNIEDYKIWKTIEGEDIRKSGFARWANGNGVVSSNPREPHCAAIDGINDGIRDWWCHRKQSFICEK